jgi:hypothetical protein
MSEDPCVDALRLWLECGACLGVLERRELFLDFWGLLFVFLTGWMEVYMGFGKQGC